MDNDRRQKHKVLHDWPAVRQGQLRLVPPFLCSGEQRPLHEHNIFASSTTILLGSASPAQSFLSAGAATQANRTLTSVSLPTSHRSDMTRRNTSLSTPFFFPKARQLSGQESRIRVCYDVDAPEQNRPLEYLLKHVERSAGTERKIFAG